MSKRQQCSERVYSGARWDFGGHMCAINATQVYEGKHYCRRHYPPHVAKREAEQRAERVAQYAAQEAENAEQQRKYEHERACLAAIASIGGDPATVAELVAALREMERVFSVTFAGSIFRVETAAILAARAVLAKVTENSDEPA